MLNNNDHILSHKDNNNKRLYIRTKYNMQRMYDIHICFANCTTSICMIHEELIQQVCLSMQKHMLKGYNPATLLRTTCFLLSLNSAVHSKHLN